MPSRRTFLKYGFASLASASLGTSSSGARPGGKFICPPCGCAMDGIRFDAPGNCPACGMTLIPEPSSHWAGPDKLRPGAGSFFVPGGTGREGKRIEVHYYVPRKFSAKSRFVLVLPGAGRNGNSYRDAWIEAADRFDLVIAAPSYTEADYDLAAYHMGGTITGLRIDNLPTAADGSPLSVVHLRDEDIKFTVNQDSSRWLFGDFDRIFETARSALSSPQTEYDMFGHSAGGQILHRLVLYRPNSKARRIVAANSGLYTLPRLDVPPLIGLGGTGVTREGLAKSLAARLTLLLGELDNGDEADGIQLHTPEFDKQGLGRLARGRYFFEAGRQQATAMGVPFNWDLSVVQDVGHSYRGMSKAAAARLYG